MNRYVFADLSIGHCETLDIDLGQREVESFICLSGDASTVHMDDEYARSRGFQKRLVHGVLVAAYISNLIGMKLPGQHGILRTLNCEFRKPCYAPSRLMITGVVASMVQSMRIASINIEVRDQSSDLLVVALAQVVLKL